jgi:sugar fermentation stimulation protein A
MLLVMDSPLQVSNLAFLAEDLPGVGWQFWTPGQLLATDCGIYVALYELHRPRRIQVGRLGRFRFEPGTYCYVGSAQRALTARLERHARRLKPKRWHIDYLAVHARFAQALVLPEAGKARECEIARALARQYATPVPGFGAPDCPCYSHLLFDPTAASDFAGKDKIVHPTGF